MRLALSIPINTYIVRRNQEDYILYKNHNSTQVKSIKQQRKQEQRETLKVYELKGGFSNETGRKVLISMLSSAMRQESSNRAAPEQHESHISATRSKKKALKSKEKPKKANELTNFLGIY